MQRDINTLIEDIVNEEIINAKKNIIIKIQEAFLTSGGFLIHGFRALGFFWR